jgi:hypothetical protein
MENTVELFTPVDPWPEEVDGDKLLNDLTAFISKYMHLPPGANHALALWVLHTYLMDAVEVTPYIAIISPQYRCGKTTLLRLLKATSHQAINAASISTPALGHIVHNYKPTLLIDEMDSFMRGSDHESTERMRGILNSGYSRGEGEHIKMEQRNGKGGAVNWVPVRWHTFCPKALAKIGDLPETLMDRNIMVSLERARDGECAKLRASDLQARGPDLQRRCMRWAEDHAEQLQANPWPRKMPKRLINRAWDKWAFLIALADAVSHMWGSRARHAAITLEAAHQEHDDNVALLSDVAELLKNKLAGEDEFVPSADVLKGLLVQDRWKALEDGKPLSAKALGATLVAHGAELKRRTRGRGFTRKSLEAMVARYVPEAA